MRSNRTWAIVCVAALSAGASGAVEFVHQDPLVPGGGYSSQDARNPGGLGWFSEVADDFTMPSGFNANLVKFWGTYGQPQSSPGHPHGFTIRFYNDASGSPGTRLFEQDVAVFNEALYFSNGTLADYSYTCNLNPAFVPSSAGRYWVSVVAILDRGGASSEPQWGWVATGSPISGSPGQYWFFSPSHSFTSTGVDLSLVVSGNNIPAPATAISLCGAVLSALRRRRR